MSITQCFKKFAIVFPLCLNRIYLYRISNDVFETQSKKNVQLTFDVTICRNVYPAWTQEFKYNFMEFLSFFRVLSFSSSSLGTFESSACPRYTWSEHALPVTDIHCGHGGMRGHVITSSLDQTCKVLLLRGCQQNTWPISISSSWLFLFFVFTCLHAWAISHTNVYPNLMLS